MGKPTAPDLFKKGILELRTFFGKGYNGLHLQYSFNVGTDPKTTYVADFYYKDGSQWIVEDVKGLRTEVYKRKKRLFEKKYPYINFIEI